MSDTLNQISDGLKENNFAAVGIYTPQLEKDIKESEVYFASVCNHQEIDNIEMTFAEMKSYIEEEQWHDALAKAQVLEFLFSHLPKNSRLKPENIF